MSDHQPQQLQRSLSLPLIVFYGIGTILGAGIYALTGKVAAESGIYTAHAFVLAAIIVSFSAYAYAQLAKRFPYSAGEAVYVKEILKAPWLATAVGWTIAFTGVVSAAALCNGFASYLGTFTAIPRNISIALLALLMTLLSVWGVNPAIRTATTITLIELFGIVIILWVGAPSLQFVPENIPQLLEFPPSAAWPAIGLGAFLAFYAYIGFEDIVNMAEEVKQPERNIPRAIFISMVVTAVIYAAVGVVAVAALPLSVLAGSDAPFAELIRHRSSLPVGFISLISLIAISNGALVQLIMGSRVLYGMANRGLAPAFLGRVGKKTRTPIAATVIVGASILCFALWLPITTLARITSSAILLVFALINVALLVLEVRQLSATNQSKSALRTLLSVAIPALGALVCLAFLAMQLYHLGTRLI